MKKKRSIHLMATYPAIGLVIISLGILSISSDEAPTEPLAIGACYASHDLATSVIKARNKAYTMENSDLNQAVISSPTGSQSLTPKTSPASTQCGNINSSASQQANHSEQAVAARTTAVIMQQTGWDKPPASEMLSSYGKNQIALHSVFERIAQEWGDTVGGATTCSQSAVQ